MAQHAASVHNWHVITEDGVNPHEAIHGQRYRGKTEQFGEQVFYYVPKRLRAKSTLKCRIVEFVWKSKSSNQAYIATANGDVIQFRTIVRLVEGSRCNTDALICVVGVPGKLNRQYEMGADAEIKELIDPHENAEQDATQVL